MISRNRAEGRQQFGRISWKWEERLRLLSVRCLGLSEFLQKTPSANTPRRPVGPATRGGSFRLPHVVEWLLVSDLPMLSAVISPHSLDEASLRPSVEQPSKHNG